jgi:integrin alpha FG-GAP repeat containing protein 1
VGSTSPQSATTLEGVIPNSKLVLNPGRDGAEWRRELFLRPGEWMWWVLLTLIGATILLLGVVFVLHVNEKVSASLVYETLANDLGSI